MIRFSTDGSFLAVLLAVLCSAAPPLALTRQQARQDALARSSSERFRGAAICPDAAHVAYAAEQRPGSGVELYCVPIGGGESPIGVGHPLLAPVRDPWTISPDGTLLYLDDAVWRTRIHGSSSPVRLSDAGEQGRPRDFAVTPDGTRIVFRAAPAGQHLGLFSVPADGSSRPIELVAPNDRGEVRHDYRVSPDGRSVVYVSSHKGSPRLYAAELDGSSTTLLQGGLPVEDFEIGPDGTRVAYRCTRARLRELRAVPIDGSQPAVTLTGAPSAGVDVKDYELGPDGSWIAFLVDQGNGRNELFGVPADGSAAPVRLATDVASSFRIHPSQLVLFKADHQQDERFALHAVPIDGRSAPVELSAPLAPKGHVGWYGVTPDGTRLVYQAYRGGNEPRPVSELWTVTMAQGIARKKLAEVEVARDFQLSPDSLRVVYRAQSASLYSLALLGGSSPTALEAADRKSVV